MDEAQTKSLRLHRAIAEELLADPDAVLAKARGNIVTSAFADDLAARSGAVVNVASALSWIALGASYGVSKAALWSATESMRLELAPRGVQVTGVYVGYVDTDMTQGVEAPKASPADVVRQVLDGLESGAGEVLADETSRGVRASLHLPVEERYAPFTRPADAR